MPTSNSILIVDDEKPILDTYQFYLGMAASNVEIGPQQPAVIRSSRSSRRAKASPERVSEYRILVACTGEEAVEIVKKEKEEGRRIAAAFFDMKMPGGIDGIETIRRIRLIDADILCTVVTAYQDSSIDDINQLFLPNHEDHWDYLNKPFTESEIRQKARNMVSSWRGRRRVEAQRRKLDMAASENRRLYCDLKALNADLEERVVARTFDLDRANTTLRSKTDELEVLVASLQETKHKLGLQEKLAVVGRLAATVAHEINNPCAYVLANLRELLEPGGLSDSGAEVVQESIEGVEHIARIVRELKTFGRGKQDLIEPLDIEAVLDHAVRILGNETELTAAFTRSYGAAEKVRGMPGRLLQVFINLIKNAAQALPDHGGTIDLSTDSRGDEVVVVVTDNGEGISCEALDRVFEPFYTTKEVGQGTGLGLSLCKSIIEEHGGRIRIESELGKGTRIEVFLPRFNGGAAVMQAAAPVPSGELRRRHVLCIDDDTRLLNMYQRMFKKQHDIKIASSGAAALEMLESFDGYDVIICDLMMPGMTGAALYDRISETKAHLMERFLFVTGGAYTPETSQFLNERAPALLEKPFPPQAALEAIERIASKREG